MAENCYKETMATQCKINKIYIKNKKKIKFAIKIQSYGV